MSDFAQALRAFQNGDSSPEQLLSEVDREVEQNHTDAVTLLAILYEENSRTELPATVHGAVERKILHWLHQYSVVRTHGPANGAESHAPDAPADNAPTVVFDIPGANDDNSSGAPSSEPRRGHTAAVGDVLHGRFKLIELIGEGGMSCVYKAIDIRKVETRSPNPYVAVKLLTVPVREYSRALFLLQREAQKVQALTHPNIVRVSDCDRDGKTVFMTMEYLSGESLQRKFQAAGFTGMPRHEAMRIIESIAGALAAAHRNGIVHGDLKPGNIIITDKGDVKVIDFGIARAMQGGTDDGGEVDAFTPSYASTERLERKDPDPRDDIYALSCIANELFTGRHPFDWKTATTARDAGLEPKRQPGVSRAQFNAVRRALAFDRNLRTPSVEGFLDDFHGKSSGKRRRTAAIAVAVLLALLAGVWWLDRERPALRSASTALPKQVASEPALATYEVLRDCPTCPLMKLIAPGRFEQGSGASDPEAQPFEQPLHTVSIARPFGLSAYEVTVAEFKEFADATGLGASGCEVYDDGAWIEQSDASWNNPGYPQTALHPVTCVSWQEANAYAQWLSAKTNQHYRLPSASEWEYAGHAGSEASRPWGPRTEAACGAANVADQSAAQRYPGWTVHACSDGYVHAAPVGSFAASNLGLYDMLGNVFEWVEDCWHDTYTGAPSDGSAWVDGDCTQREMRGGSWFTTPAFVRTAHRNRFETGYRSSSIGFRIARDIPE